MGRRSLTAQKKNIDFHNNKQEAEYQTAQRMIEDLKESREDIKRQLHQKTILLNISENCRKVTAQRCSVRQRPSTAPGDTRPGRKSHSLTHKNTLPMLPSIDNGDLTRSVPEASTSTPEVIVPNAKPDEIAGV